YVIDKLGTKLWILDNGQVEEFIGTFTDYREAQRQAELAQAEERREKAKRSARTSSLTKQPSLQALARERKAVEEEITQLEKRKEELEQMMVSPELYQDELESQRVIQEYHKLDQQLLYCYERWENLVDKYQEG
ncbi:MAG: hypothetical protein GX331_09880, partial [Firmicutes bacterium]|nr:hypothetical protein [Bacillota bacterium]